MPEGVSIARIDNFQTSQARHKTDIVLQHPAESAADFSGTLHAARGSVNTGKGPDWPKHAEKYIGLKRPYTQKRILRTTWMQNRH